MGAPDGSWTTIACGMTSVIRRSSRSSSRSFASVCFRVSMSVHVPYHLTILPVSSRSGSTRMRNQRNTPSKRQRRASISPGSPDDKSTCHFSSNRARSSGWIAACQPEPWDSSGESPVYSCQRLLRNSLEPSGRMDQASVGIVSITCRSFLSEFFSSSSALLSASCDRCRVPGAIGGLYDRRRFLIKEEFLKNQDDLSGQIQLQQAIANGL